MESLIIFLFLIGMLVASILILQIYKLLKEKTLGKAITELPSPVKQEIKRTPSYSPFLDENRADLMRKHILRGIGIFFLIVVIMVATAIKEDFSIIIALITSAIIGGSIFLLLEKIISNTPEKSSMKYVPFVITE